MSAANLIDIQSHIFPCSSSKCARAEQNYPTALTVSLCLFIKAHGEQPTTPATLTVTYNCLLHLLMKNNYRGNKNSAFGIILIVKYAHTYE